MRYQDLLPAALATACLLAGCGPTQEQVNMAKAMSARYDRQPTYNESCRFLDTYAAKRDRDYVMWAMDYASLCLMSGNYDEAKDELMKCHVDIETRQDTDKERAAAVSNEALKVFKGEPFERAMVCWYLGLLHYMEEDYNNARIFFSRANMADATTEEDCKEFRDDFALAHYWLGRAFMKLGQEDNASVAFRKAGVHVSRKGEQEEHSRIRAAQKTAREKRMRLEKESVKLAQRTRPPVEGAADMSHSPPIDDMPNVLPAAQTGADRPLPVELYAQKLEQFLSLDYQKQVNLILIVETGLGPVKYLIGENGCLDAIARAPYEDRQVLVYLDGHKAGPAFQLLDLFHQADTRGTSEKDRAQLAKGITQSVLRRLPYIGYAAAYWDVRADYRYWHLMPGEVHVFAAKVKPGTYTVNLQCFDSNGCLLPRYSQTRYCVPVRDGQENIYLIHIKPEADNVYFAKP